MTDEQGSSEASWVCGERYRAHLEAQRKCDAAYARAYLHHDGPAHEKRHAAELATQEQRGNN